ncbi:MAG: hypothetical protein GY822_17525 [Deltaproteobacteria bacterium]|nr:hypothetical protein [Deltaproteobacteria bacterium]
MKGPGACALLFRLMLVLPAVHQTEVIDLRHAKMLLEKPKKACTYPRDGQLKLDEKDLPTPK